MTTTPSQPAAAPDAAREELIHAGILLSNCAFNLAQANALDDRARHDHIRQSLDACRRRWDAALSEFRRAIASPAATADERESFEKWSRDESELSWVEPDGVRNFDDCAWRGWQARAALSTASPRPTVMAELVAECKELAYEMCRQDAAAVLLDYGLQRQAFEKAKATARRFEAAVDRIAASPQGEAVASIDEIMKLAYEAAQENIAYWRDLDPDAQRWVESKTYAALRAAITNIAAPRAPAPDAAPAGEPLRGALAGLLEIEEARIKTGEFKPNAEGLKRIEAARAALAAPAGEPTGGGR